MDDCQVVVTSHYVDRVFDWPIVARLYLPESWAHGRQRRQRAQVPKEACPESLEGSLFAPKARSLWS